MCPEGPQVELRSERVQAPAAAADCLPIVYLPPPAAAAAAAAPRALLLRRQLEARAVQHVHTPVAHHPAQQGLTLVHLSAQRKRFWRDKGYLGGVQGVLKAGMEAVFRRLGDVLSVRNGSG